jgi:hypothetical protein
MRKILLSMAFVPCLAFAHPGGLNADGCHKKSGVEHCHGKGENQKALATVKNADRERGAGHKLQCRGTPGVKGSQPTYDLAGKPCKPSEAAR